MSKMSELYEAKEIIERVQGSPWRRIEYGLDDVTGQILLPNGAPFDGKPVLIKTRIGIVEAWWDEGRIARYAESEEAEGFQWICYDSAFQADLDDALWWMPIPPFDEPDDPREAALVTDPEGEPRDMEIIFGPGSE